MRCPICQQANARIGVLCQACRDALVGPVAITQEQIQTSGPATSPAALIDMWGGAHPLSLETAIGRSAAPPALTILQPSVSRRHATLTFVDLTWFVRDLGSAHGTFVDDRSAERPLALRTGSKLRVGYIAFYFVEDARGLAPGPLHAMSQTSRPARPLVAPVETRDLERISPLPMMTIKLQEPTGGGGGMVDLDGTRLQLTLPQYELVSRLVQRMHEEVDRPDAERGFISPAELVRTLSLDSTEPGEDHVRQLVSRLRRACEKAGLPDLIETKYRLGYRLGVVPRLK